ncbi:beta-N-acetylhexosaminidase [Denitratisoma sp. agr-D3]
MNTPRQPISQPISQPLGPLFIDIAGTELTALDRERLSHPLVGGIILFSRNYQDREQLDRLCAEIHALRSPRLPISIDHEGGRVQRCREGFTALPAMAQLGRLWDEQGAEIAESAARQVGYVLAAELRACGVDFSFTPVLDLDYGRSTVIGNRSFHRQPVVVARLAAALIEGLREAGMGACGKHFPGHGWVEADSHVAIPVDERSWEAIQEDMRPYQLLRLDAVMPAHVIYPKVDQRPAGFSPVWIGKLRSSLGFSGVIFSDDLSMAGAAVAGDVLHRVQAARAAGCDALLVCNSPDDVATLLRDWQPQINDTVSSRIERLLPAKAALDWASLQADERYRTALRVIAQRFS